MENWCLTSIAMRKIRDITKPTRLATFSCCVNMKDKCELLLKYIFSLVHGTKVPIGETFLLPLYTYLTCPIGCFYFYPFLPSFFHSFFLFFLFLSHFILLTRFLFIQILELNFLKTILFLYFGVFLDIENQNWDSAANTLFDVFLVSRQY